MHTCTFVHHRTGLLEHMPAMSTKATSTEANSILQNGEPSAVPAETTPQLPLQVQN